VPGEGAVFAGNLDARKDLEKQMLPMRGQYILSII
jgi:hypothetical protein